MRWFVSLSSAVLVSVSASAQADQPLTIPQSSAVRQQTQSAVTVSPSVRSQANLSIRRNAVQVPQVATVTVDEAATKPAPAPPAPPAPAAEVSPVTTPAQPQAAPAARYQPVRRQSQGLFGQIMELERRKNAWLRGMFR